MRAYQQILKNVLLNGHKKQNRTGIDTVMLSGQTFQHDMAEGFPRITCRYVPFKNARIELEMNLKGISSKKWLHERNCHIWDDWCTPGNVPYKNDEDTKRKMREEDELGPIYGVQWVKWLTSVGTEYLEYLNQIDEVVNSLLTQPNDRRMVVTAWRPDELHLMALPPCYLLWQITLAGDGRLDMCWYQRSCDILLGLPNDIMVHALLLELLCKEAGLKPGILTGFLCDTHVYANHIDKAFDLISESILTYPLCRLQFDTMCTGIYSYTCDSVKCINYQSGPKMKFEVAV